MKVTLRFFSVLFVFFIIASVQAATRTITTNWGQWSNTGIWQGGDPPAGTGGDDVYSNVNGLNTTVDGSYTVTGIIFNRGQGLIVNSDASLIINGDFTSNSGLSITVNNNATLTINGNVHASGDLVIINNGGYIEINGDVSSDNGNITITNNGKDTYISGGVLGSKDVDLVSNNGGPLEIGGGVEAGNNASFTANDDLIIGGVVDVGNSAVFTGNGNDAVFELGGIVAGNGTSLTFNGDAKINGDVTLGQNTSMTVNSGTLTVTDNFTSGGGNTNYTVHDELVVGGNLNLDNGTDNINGSGTVTTGGDCAYNTEGSSGITQNCEVTREIALPVSLLWFKGESIERNIALTWLTASEKNNHYFTIEKSVNGLDFSTVADVQGAGDSKERQYYSYVDTDQGGQRVLYYRLSQTDFDGTHVMLKVVSVGSATGQDRVQLAPNVLFGNTVVKAEGARADMSWKVISLSGHVLRCGSFIGGNQLRLDDLGQGVYLFEVTSPNSRSTQRFVVK